MRIGFILSVVGASVVLSACSVERIAAPEAATPTGGGRRLVWSDPDLDPVDPGVRSYLASLRSDYLNLYGYVGGPCVTALDTFIDRLAGQYYDSDHDSFGYTYYATRNIGINAQRLGNAWEDLDSMFHEGFHSEFDMSLSEYSEQAAIDFASGCMTPIY